MVSANVALTAEKDTSDLPFGLRESLESTANLAVQSLLDRFVPAALVRLRDDYSWWAGLSATTSGAPAFRRAFELGAAPRPQYLAPVSVEHLDTQSAYRSAVRAAISGGDDSGGGASGGSGPSGALRSGSTGTMAAAPAATHTAPPPPPPPAGQPLSVAAAQAAIAAARDRARAILRGGTYRPKRRVLPVAARAHLAPEKYQPLIVDRSAPEPSWPVGAAKVSTPPPTAAAAAAPKPPPPPPAAASAPLPSTTTAAGKRTPLRGGQYAPKKRVLSGTFDRKARLAGIAGAASASAASPAPAPVPPASTKAPAPVPVPTAIAKSAAAAAAIHPDPVAAAVESMAEVSRRASNALYVAAQVVRSGMEVPEEQRAQRIDALLSQLRDAEMALLEARATERAAVQAAEAAIAKQRQEQRGSVVVAETLLSFALAKSKETVLNAEDMLVKAEDALERMQAGQGGGEAAAFKQQAAPSAGASAASSAQRAGRAAPEAQPQQQQPASGPGSAAAGAAAGSQDAQAKQAAVDRAAADAAAAERSIHFDEFASQPGVTKCQASRSLRFDVLCARAMSPHAASGGSRSLSAAADKPRPPRVSILFFRREPLDAQGKPLFPLEQYIADADNLVRERRLSGVHAGAEHWRLSTRLRDDLTGVSGFRARQIRLAVRDENLKRLDSNLWGADIS